ncbi:MAG: sugar ABC transporter ATP-binding protein [Fimbriimonadaceae bacterium]|nr:sugar ABC transporter ATP-binding protein [Fimbriimonadaceae bacterium]
MATILETRHITKRFPGVVALDEVSVQVETGSCHALMGENGAGKSTLGKIIAGLYQPDSGEIWLDGSLVQFANPLAAMRVGIGMVHQELVFCENLSVAENLCLDSLPASGIFLQRGEMIRRATEWLEALQVQIDPQTPVGDLPIAKQQLIQIAGAVGRGARVIIFDEPTSSLSLFETEMLYGLIRKIRAAGVTCVYVSHRMDEIYELCDTVTVLRDGCLVETRPLAETSRDELVKMMVGRQLEAVDHVAFSPQLGDVALTVEGLSSPDRFENISLSLRRGEILGLAGLVGAGRTEVVEALFGLDPGAVGNVTLLGKEISHPSPSKMLSAGFGLVPEDRKRHGLVLNMNARENISLPTLDRLAQLGWVRMGEERDLAEQYFETLRVKAPNVESGAVGLSGGNQQKLVIAKWLAAHCEVLALDEPTRGVDVGAKAEIHELIRGLALQGKAVIVVSSDLPELLALSTRILVLRNGRIEGEVTREQATEEAVMRLMTGVGATA